MMEPTPSGYPYQSIAKCSVSEQDGTPHKAGVLLVTAKDSTTQAAASLRCCVDCLYDLCEALKADNYVELRVTAPEAPSYGVHRR